MYFLITNDDGIDALGLKQLVSVALKYGKCIVVAPITEQSAKSHAINIKTPFHFEKVKDIIEGVDTYVIDSSPADCVRVANYYLKEDFDIVLSGVNNGYNLGEDIIYSGTCAAATEGVLSGHKGIALSVKYGDTSKVSYNLDKALKYIFDKKLLDVWPLLNVNIDVNAKDIIFTRQGNTNYLAYYELDDSNLKSVGKNLDQKDSNVLTDVYQTMHHNITITPLNIDRTEYKALEKLILKK